MAADSSSADSFMSYLMSDESDSYPMDSSGATTGDVNSSENLFSTSGAVLVARKAVDAPRIREISLDAGNDNASPNADAATSGATASGSDMQATSGTPTDNIVTNTGTNNKSSGDSGDAAATATGMGSAKWGGKSETEDENRKAAKQIDFSAMTGEQIRALPLAQVESFTALQLTMLDGDGISVICELTKEQMQHVDPINLADAVDLAISPVNPDDTNTVSGATILSELTGMQLLRLDGQLSPADIGTLTNGQLAELERAGNSGPFFIGNIENMQDSTGGYLVADLTALQVSSILGKLTSIGVQRLAGTQVQQLSPGQLAGHDVLGNPVISDLTAAQVTQLPAANLNSAPDGNPIASWLLPIVIPFVDPAKLTASTLSAITPAQTAAFTSAQLPMVDGSGNVLALDLADGPGATGLTSNQLSFSNIDEILKSVDNTIGAGGLTDGTLALLRSLDSATQTADGSTSATACLLDNMVDELTAGTGQLGFKMDLSQWFEGGIDPGLPAVSNDLAAGVAPLNRTYKDFGSYPLFLSNATSQYLNVAQGGFGSCYLVASLIEDALQNPADLQNLITEESNGTYAVRFYGTNGVNYVDVNSDLPVNTVTNANGTTSSFFAGSTCSIPNSGQSASIWVGLVEKAYIEWCNAEPAEAYAPAAALQFGNSYSFYTYGGLTEGLQSLTGQNVGFYSLSSTALASTGATYQALVSAWNAHQLVMFGCVAGNASSIGLVKGHAFAFDGFDQSGNCLLINPWGAGSTNSQVIALSVQQLLSLQSEDGQGFYIANGSQSNPAPSGPTAPLLVQAMAGANTSNAASTTGAATAANLLVQSNALASSPLLHAA